MHQNNQNSQSGASRLQTELQLLKDELPVGYILNRIILDDEGKPTDYEILELNGKAAEMLETDKEKITGKSIKTIFPEIEDKWISIFGEVALSGNSISFDNYLSYPDKYYDGRAYSPEKGKFVIIFSEVTHRKLSEISLRETQDRYRRLVEKLPDMVYIYSNRSGGIYYSPSVEDILGYSPQYLVKNPYKYQELIHPDDIHLINETISNLPDKDNFDVEFRIRDKYGMWHWIRNRLIRKIESENEIIVEGLGTDITEYKNLYQELDREKKQIETAFNSIPAFIFTQNIEHDILFANDKFKNLFGEPDNKKCYEILHGINKPCDDCCGDKALLSDQFCTKEVKLINDRHYLITSSVIKKNGNEKIILETGIDISDWKKAQEDILESESKYMNIFENAPVGIFRSTPEGRFIDVNPKLAEMLGYDSPSDVIENVKDIEKEIYVKTNKRKEVIEKAKESDSYKNFENVYRKKDGNKFIANLYLRTIRDKKGNIEFLEGMVEDITLRKRIEDQLKVSEKNFRTVISNLPHAVFAHDLDGRFVLVNKVSAKNTGYTEEELLEMYVSDVDPSVLTRKDREKIWLSLEAGESVQIEAEHQRKDGSIYPAEITISAIEIKGKKILLAVAQDISIRKETEKALRESEEKFRSFFVNSNDGIAITDEKGCVEEWNSAMEKITGIKKEEASGKKIYDVQLSIAHYYKDKPAKVKEIIKSIEDFLVTGKAPWTDKISQTEVKAKDGKIKIMESRTFGFKTEKGYKAASIVRDVTELKKIENQLKKSRDELQQALAEKDKFFSIIAHDIRSPLSGFIRLSKDLSEEYANMTFQEINLYANSLYESSSYLYSLLDNLLEWSRLQRNLHKFEPKKLKMRDLVVDCYNLLKLYSLEKGVKIKNRINPEVEVFADKNMVMTVLRNLMSNALKFSYKNGIIEIASEMPEKQEVVFSVTDKGKGMPDEIKETLFSLEHKNIELGTEEEKGAGLGLILCKEYIEKNGGKIWFESERDKGTIFYFSLRTELNIEE